MDIVHCRTAQCKATQFTLTCNDYRSRHTYLITYLHFNFYYMYIKNHAERKENWMKDVNISTRKNTEFVS